MSEAAGTSRVPRAVRWILWSVGVLLALWALLWLAVPPIVKSQAESRASALLGREVRIGNIGFEPWSLTLSVDKLSIASAAGSTRGSEAQFSLERAVINADLRSLFKLAPVIEAVQLDTPVLRVARTAEGRYDFDDIAARLAKPEDAAAKKNEEPARFALYNLRLSGGAVEFDDRPVQRVHRLQDLSVALPFLSNLPADVAINVEPRVAFKLNGASFDTGAQSKPFAQDRASQIELAIADLDLAPWLPYMPNALPLKPSRGRLATKLSIQFALDAGGAPRIGLRGQASLADMALAAAGAASVPAVAWRKLDVALADVQPLARKIALGDVTLAGAQIDARRAADGRINLVPPAASAPPAAAASAPAGKPAVWNVSIAKFALAQARIDWHDASTRPAAALRIEPLDVEVGSVRWPFEAPAPIKLSARLKALEAQGAAAGEGALLTLQGQATDRAADATLDLQGLDLAWLEPYVAQALAARIEGRASAKAALAWAAGDAPKLALNDVSVQLDELRLTDGAARARPPLSIASLSLDGAQIDLRAQQVSLGRVKIERPSMALVRDAQARWNFEQWMRPSPTATPAEDSNASPAWKIRLTELALSGGEVRLSDLRPAPNSLVPVQVTASAIQANVQGFEWPAGASPARTQLQLRIAQGDGAAAAKSTGKSASTSAGRIDWTGQITAAPLAIRGTLRAERVPVHVFEPYFGGGMNLALLRAEANWRGDIALAQRGKAWDASAKGDALLADVRVHERSQNARAGDELLSWQAFSVKGVRFDMRGTAKPKLEIAEAALTDFYSRLVITEQGRFNLRDVAAAPGEAASAPAVAAAAPASAASAPVATDLPIDIAVGGVRLSNGRVDFTDRFVRPNYSAALSELNGSLGAFNSNDRAMATLDLKGRAAGTALLEISGAVNPSARPLALDIRAKATDLELAPLSPYAGRYAGYAIERGKLSMDVAYKIDPDGKLDAKNQVILNQLTFGDKVESPDATKLPVLLAVALLKDRNGVIDINLPVSGSINDPQFSVFGIVLKIIGNLLVKALTAPFALLAGGGSDDLSFVGFEAGTTTFSDSGKAAIDKVAKALIDRPALKMTVTGAADPASERDAIQRAALDARIKAEQRRDLLRGGGASDAALPVLSSAERDALVKRLYSDTKLPDKPRNAIGLAKDIPVPEMETLLKKATVVSTDNARELALQRGLAVRDALIAKGLPSERLFLAAPKLRASGEEDKEWSPRVQLALGTQ